MSLKLEVLLAEVREDEGESGQPDGGVGGHALPHAGVEQAAAHALQHGLQQAVGAAVVLAALLQARQHAGQEPVQTGRQARAHRHEVGLVHRQQTAAAGTGPPSR